MNDAINPKQFARELANWFRENKRDLPFRKTKDPYKIFLSELMLQQTQMDTVIPYYERFIKVFPTITDLANASLDDVYKLWQGLGYYRRAKYIHETAKIIRDEYQGVFPSDLNSIRKLKGVGNYTAGAIHSIAFKQPTPAVDGNVMRVMSRVLMRDDDIALTKNMKTIETILKSYIVHEDPSDFTEGMMELGALICQKTPKCNLCPVSKHCLAFKHDKVHLYPYKSKLKEKTIENYYVIVLKENMNVLLRQRPSEGLLANMLEFPQYETPSLEIALKQFEEEFNLKVINHLSLNQTIKHVFTHKIWMMHSVIVDVSQHPYTLIPMDQLPKAMSKAHLKIMSLLKVKT
ncbi:MAG: A/G-specific adenine glycosylase [Candidatus Izemoplasmataceae bacterium]